MKKRYIYQFLLVCISSCFLACNGYLEEIPQNKQKLTSTDDYEQLLNKAYLTEAVLPYIDLLTDDISYIVADRDPRFGNVADSYLGAYMWDNNIESTMPNGDEVFGKFYNSIYYTNVVIDEVDQAVGISSNKEETERIRGYLKGEAYALRAFRYLYLVNMYAPPYDPATSSTTPGIPINLDKPYTREMLDKVYEQIVDDLKKAIPLMEENYVNVKKNRFSPIAAKALLARVYLYMQEWDLAIEQAEDVIGSNSSLFDLRDEGENPIIYNENPLSYMSEDNVPGIGYLSEKK